jgi:hypothetical protein
VSAAAGVLLAPFRSALIADEPLLLDVHEGHGRAAVQARGELAVPALGLREFNLDAAQLEHVLVLAQRRVPDAQRVGLGLRRLERRVRFPVGLPAQRVGLRFGEGSSASSSGGY